MPNNTHTHTLIEFSWQVLTLTHHSTDIQSGIHWQRIAFIWPKIDLLRYYCKTWRREFVNNRNRNETKQRQAFKMPNNARAERVSRACNCLMWIVACGLWIVYCVCSHCYPIVHRHFPDHSLQQNSWYIAEMYRKFRAKTCQIHWAWKLSTGFLLTRLKTSCF